MRYAQDEEKKLMEKMNGTKGWRVIENKERHI
jgi:hypothetical protein